MEHKLATAERKVLVQLVKLVQQRGLEGEKGGWKEFLNFHDKKIGSSLSDPSRRANDVLIAFLMTFKKKEDVQLFARVLQLDANRELIEKFKEESPDKETPEQRLVRMTIGHFSYPSEYSFPSFSEDWFVSEMGKKKSKVMKSTRMVAIDCEMVTCDDGSEAVVRVGAVDRDLNVILDKFVKPDKPVIDYKTDITGVTAEDLERATLTVADIQKKLRRFLSKGTILVGHSLNKDLNVLKIDHARVIDTANVFKFSTPTNLKKPSLNYLSKLVLGQEVRKVNTAHNCVHDAVAAMKIVLAVVEKGIDTSVPESEEDLEKEKIKKEAEKNRLLLHRIPQYVRSQDLQEVITGDFTIEVKPSKKPGVYSAVVIFNSPEEANQAFENFDGRFAKDKNGLPQKLVKFKFSSGSEAELYVRKNVQDGEISATTTARTEENNVSEETREADVNHGSEEMLEAETTRLENEKKKLLLHKIPQSVSSQEIRGVITGEFTLDIMPSKKRGFYTAVAIFNSLEEANQAFENVDGELAKDRMGLPQKLAKFKFSSGSEAELYIRKMVKDDEISATTRASTDENNDSEKTREANVNHDEEMTEAETTRLENEKTKLLLHKIPIIVSSQELEGVVTGKFTLEIMSHKKRGGYYSAVAIFNSPEEANQAFENVKGELAKDRMGLPQKLAKCKLSSGSEASLYVRKMVEDGVVTAIKRARPEENTVSSKRQKKEDNSEDHLKEIEELKQKLKAKESVKRSDDHLKEIEELKQKLKAKDSVKSSDEHLKVVEELKQKLKAKEFQIQTQDKMIENLKKKLEMKSKPWK